MTIRRIGLDFDDTLLPTRRAIVDYLNHKHGTKIVLEELTEYYFSKPWGFDDKGFYEMFTQNEVAFHDIGPLPGVLETLSLWTKTSQLFIITGRPEFSLPPAQAWLQRHGIPVQRILAAAHMADKARLAIQENITLFVEDNAPAALAIAESGIDVLLLNAPYNQNCSHPRIRRVRDWHEIQSLECESFNRTHTVVQKGT